jgi:hypothetical protein
MELPDDVLKIIKNYSMPITRPDWRSLHKMTQEQFERDYYIEFRKRQRNELRFQRMHRHLGFATTSYLRYMIFNRHIIAQKYND